MNKDQKQIAKISDELRGISSKLSFYHAQYYRMLDELHQTMDNMKACNRNIVEMYRKEMVGRSLSDGLSEKQFLLGNALDALVVGMEDLQMAYKKIRGVSKVMDGLEETEKAIGVCLKFLGK